MSRSRARRRPNPTALLAVVVLAAWTLPARADTSPYYLGASQAFTHEANLLQLGDDQVTPAGYSRSDNISTTTLLAGFDQPFGRQHAHADLSLSDNRFRANPVYDNRSYAANAGLDWSTAERVSGTLEASVNRSLASFNNYYGLSVIEQRNLQTVGIAHANLSVGLVTQYSLVVDLSHRHVGNSLDVAAVQARDFDQDNGSIGLRWNPRGATKLGIAVGSSEGHYPKFLLTPDGFESDRFRQDHVDLTATLQPSGASTFDGRLSYTRTRYHIDTQRDFSGVTGTLGWSWQPDAKFRLHTRLTRDNGQSSYGLLDLFGLPATTDYSTVSNILRVQGDVDLTAKTSLTAAAQTVDRRIAYSVQDPLFPGDVTGRDRATTLSAGFRWAPLRSVLAGCDLSRVRRSASGAATYPLHDNLVSCFGQFQLQR